MEFLEKCCFCVPLYKGTITMAMAISILCPLNVILSLVEIQKGKHTPSHFVFIVTNSAICLFVQLITFYIRKSRPYTWFVGFSMFGFVLCQIIALLVIMTDYERFEFRVFFLSNTVVTITLLFYFVFMVTSIFYSFTRVAGCVEAQVKASTSH